MYLIAHLRVAQEMQLRWGGFEDTASFYRGALAPDAPMFRAGGKREDKAHSHFCVGDQGWGRFTNDAQWRQSILRRMEDLKGRASDSFLAGYLSHVWADMVNNERLWTPLRMTAEDKPDQMEAYQRDIYEIDSRLMLELRDRKDLWAMLERPGGEGLPGLAEAADIDNLIHVMIHQMYKDRLPKDGYVFSRYTMEDMSEYVRDVSDQVMGLIGKARC